MFGKSVGERVEGCRQDMTRSSATDAPEFDPFPPRGSPGHRFPVPVARKFALGDHSNHVGNQTEYSGTMMHCVALRPSSFEREDPMLPTFRPTPTCTRFQPTTEMACLKCGVLMRLALIEPHGPSYHLLTYHCVPCDSGESFLKAM
jgi:hypothetical protein